MKENSIRVMFNVFIGSLWSLVVCFGHLKLKSNLHYSRGITPKRVTSGGPHLRGLGLGQHSSEETSQRWLAVGNSVSDLTGPKIEPQTFRTDSKVFNN